MTLTAPAPTAAPSPARGLVCRNCGATSGLVAEHACAECFGPLEVDYDPERMRAVTRAPIEAGPHTISPHAAPRARPRHPVAECFAPREVDYDPERMRAVTREQIEAGPQNIWRYAALLPVGQDPAGRVSLDPGMTPLVRADRLAAELGLTGGLWVKDDSANPTHSFKDRVVSLAATAAKALGYRGIACASTGNLANSVAAPRGRAAPPAAPAGGEGGGRGARPRPPAGHPAHAGPRPPGAPGPPARGFPP